MLKRITAAILCMLLLMNLSLPVRATEEEAAQKETLVIYHEMNFLKFAEQCRLDSYSENLIVELRGNLDLTDMDFSGIPMFCGVFNGNGHSIKGLNIVQDGSVVGLFRYLSNTAVVQDLHVEGTVQPIGTRSEVGGIAGSNAGQILRCSFTGTVSGNNYVGCIAGQNEVSGVIDGCHVNGTVSASHFAGGIAGANSGVIRQCENNASVNITAVENLVDLTDITLESLTRSEFAATVTDIGGIAGTSNGVIRDSDNYGAVGYRHMGYNIGGIAGTQSGLVHNCRNFGSIQGRKEIGGIVGQLEPTALIQYEEDALQILQRQLSGMGSIVNSTVSNVQGTSSAIMGQVGMLQTHVGNAKDAVDTLIPDIGDTELPDADTIQAAQNTLSSSLSGMTTTLQGMGGTAYNAMGAISTNLYSLQNQINAMRTTLGNVSETLGGSITDVSDKDTEEDMTGKVSDCINYGGILADRNGGGIAGAMAMENDLDAQEDWAFKGSNSLNFESELRAVIVNCENAATVTVKKENAGGIVGWQSMGLVKNSRNSGSLEATAADYVGGISGQSKGFIRNCSAKGTISGTNYVGGIAGSATILSGSRSMVDLETRGEMTGAVLGATEMPFTEEENPISDNYYLKVSQDRGGIDGISYAGQAQPLVMEEFLILEDLPEMFRTVFVRFTYPNGTQREFEIPIGGSFDKNWAPPIPPRENAVVFWEGLEDADLTGLLFDVTFETDYHGQKTVISSGALLNDQPILLIQGVFELDAAAVTNQLDAPIPVEKGEYVEGWEFTVTGAQSITAIRLRLPEELDAGHAAVQIRNADGIWRSTDAAQDGSYLVIPLEGGDNAVALIRERSYTAQLIYGAIGLSLVLLAVALYRRKRKS